MSTFDRVKFLLDSVDADVDRARRERDEARAEGADLTAQLAEALEKLAECEANHQTPDPDPEPPTPSNGNTDLAVRVFPHYSGKVYGNHAAVLDQLGELGVKRISALLTPGMAADEIAFYQNAHTRHGIKVWFAIGKPGVTFSSADWERVRFLLAGPLAGVVELASGWNEPNHRVSNFAGPTAIHQKALWSNIQQVNAATGQSIKVGTPPLHSGNVNEQYADLREMAPLIQGAYDTINWHLYPHGNTGADLAALIDRQVAEFTAAYGDVPIVNSESGYSTSIHSTKGNPVTEEQQAERLAELVALHRARGIRLSYFELDDDPDPTFTNREAHFGLYFCPSLDPATWRRKPAFYVFRDLLAA